MRHIREYIIVFQREVLNNLDSSVYADGRRFEAAEAMKEVLLPTRWSLANFTLGLQISQRGLNSAPIAPVTMCKGFKQSV